MEVLGIILVIATALAFDYTNGFHDAANAIATSVSTRALTPRVALMLAAVMNLIGAFLGTGVAKTVGSGIIEAPSGTSGLVVVFCALIGAIAWNLTTWYFGLPSSSSHALIGGLIGAAIASAGVVLWSGVVDSVLLPMVISPLVGFTLAYLLMVAILWTFRHAHPGTLTRRFRLAQTVSAAGMALGHGLQDAQKTMGVIVLALVTAGYQDTFDIPGGWSSCPPARCQPGRTPAAGASCARLAVASSSSTRRAALRPRRPRPRCCTSLRLPSMRRSPPRRRSPRRSWG